MQNIFRGESVTLGNINFWEEFFLLKPKMGALESEIGALQVLISIVFRYVLGLGL